MTQKLMARISTSKIWKGEANLLANLKPQLFFFANRKLICKNQIF